MEKLIFGLEFKVVIHFGREHCKCKYDYKGFIRFQFNQLGAIKYYFVCQVVIYPQTLLHEELHSLV